MNNQNNETTQDGIVKNHVTETNKKLFGVLAYLGILIVISYVFAKDNSFVKFHIKQGLVLVVIELIMWVLGSMFWSLWPVYSIVNLITLILSIIGIVNVLQNKEKPLPLVGQFAGNFSI